MLIRKDVRILPLKLIIIESEVVTQPSSNSTASRNTSVAMDDEKFYPIFETVDKFNQLFGMSLGKNIDVFHVLSFPMSFRNNPLVNLRRDVSKNEIEDLILG